MSPSKRHCQPVCRGLAGIVVAACSIALPVSKTVQAVELDAWPHWRGPQGSGAAPAATPPTEFDGPRGLNVRWKTPLPGRGSSSPVVWGEMIFVTTAVPSQGKGDRLDFQVLCLDRGTGAVRWSRSAAHAVPHEGTHHTNTFASASPCTDGTHVYAHFGSRGLHCFTVDGEPVWSRDLGSMRMRHGFGEGSSPTLAGSFIVVPWDHEGTSFVHALDRTTGHTVWSMPRDEPSSWATPLVATDAEGRRQVVMNGQNAARGYDLETGRELWQCGGQTARPVASPVAADGVAFVGSGYRGAFLAAFDLAGRGDLAAGPHLLWSVRRDTPDVASPLLSNGRIYFYKDKTGLLTCLDARTGTPHYATARIPGVTRTYASPVAAGGRVYLTDRGGTITVIDDDDELRVVAVNDLGEGVDATPAPVGNVLIIRGEQHLFCLGPVMPTP